METVVTDRRHAPRRRTLDEHGVVSARVRPGHEVALIDVSAGGALIECMRGLSPGSIIELHVTAGGPSRIGPRAGPSLRGGPAAADIRVLSRSHRVRCRSPLVRGARERRALARRIAGIRQP